MPDNFNHPAEIERTRTVATVVTFPDLGWGTTDGATRDEAPSEAPGSLLGEPLAATMREAKGLPDPTEGGTHRCGLTAEAVCFEQRGDEDMEVRSGDTDYRR